MDKKTLKELLPIMHAFVNGEVIESRIKGAEVSWSAISNPMWDDSMEYRIKPNKVLVPFKMEDIKLFRDKWYRTKEGINLHRVNHITHVEVNSCYINGIRSDKFLEEYIFEDNTPCGKCIEQ